MTRVFVYGLLRPGLRLHHVIAPFAQHWTPATVDGRLYDVGLPAARFDRAGRIDGFVADLRPGTVDRALAVLDELEDQGELYRRVTVTARTAEGDVDAWCYEYIGPVDGARLAGPSWEGSHMRQHTFVSGTGHVVVDGHGARVAELRPTPDGTNLLWRGDDAPVPGGDRLWIAPELHLFYAKPGDPSSTWRVLPEIDPGDWDMSIDADRVVFSQTALGAEMRREVRPLVEPPEETSMRWAGYTVTDTIETDEPMSAWHIVMVPTPARVFVRHAEAGVTYYPPVPQLRESWLPATGRPPRWKVGYPPPPDGRALLAAVGEEDPGPLVCATAELDPDGTYVDVTPDGREATAVQIYGSGGEGFCELEFHAPSETRSVTTTVFGVWGPRSNRIELLGRLT